MHTETVVRIRGTADAVFAYAARVEDWPRLLPHYRGVRVVATQAGGRVVEMRARRGRVPVSWWARQVVLPAERRIRYTHLRGVTRGMEVEWRIVPAEDSAGESVVVTIVHDLALRWPLVGRVIADRIIGPKFVEPIAGATLRRIKWLVEQGHAPDTQDAARGSGGVRR
jgi:aromatase